MGHLLNGARARVVDPTGVEHVARIVSYPPFGSDAFALVWFDGDPEPLAVHRSRVVKILSRVPRWEKEGEAWSRLGIKKEPRSSQ